MRLSLIILTLLLFTSYAPPETPIPGKLSYTLLKDGKAIGKISASRTVHGEQVIYEVETFMNVKILISQKVAYTLKAVYQNGVLQSSTAKSYVNDKLHHTCVTLRKGNHYEIRKDNNINSLSRTIAYSGVMLYFREAGATNLVYSEMSGQDNTMRRNGDGQYILTDSKSKKQSRYWYKGGILDNASINHTLLDIEVQRVN